MDLKQRSLRDELIFLLDSTVDLPSDAYDRDTLLLRLESAVLVRNDALCTALESVWAAIGDALCSGRGIEKEYAWAVQREIKAALVMGGRSL